MIRFALSRLPESRPPRADVPLRAQLRPLESFMVSATLLVIVVVGLVSL